MNRAPDRLYHREQSSCVFVSAARSQRTIVRASLQGSGEVASSTGLDPNSSEPWADPHAGVGSRHVRRDGARWLYVIEDNVGGASGFADLTLAPELCHVLSDLGYEEPTPIQLAAIPPLLDGRDLVGQAATGTGKTAASPLPG